VTSAAISLVVLMTVRPQTVHSSSPTSSMAVKLQARKAQEVRW
jgi:hypothetical protein